MRWLTLLRYRLRPTNRDTEGGRMASSGEPTRGHYRPGRPSNDHARGFSLALEDALNKLRDEYPEELERPESLGTREIRFSASLTVRNPADIDEYFAELI
jgi:hypothetical protein